MSVSFQSVTHRFFLWLWYGHSPWRWWLYPLLYPLTGVFRVLAYIRRRYLLRRAYQASVPVVVVGNITLGGTGKTPVVIALVQALRQQGYHVGVISRGYGSAAPVYPQFVLPTTAVAIAGDEALLIAQQTGAPVVIDPNRVNAVKALLHQHPDTQIIVSDDGLQHYALGRAMEWVVLDGHRGLGNGFCLPLGPLREPRGRLQRADWLLVNTLAPVADTMGLPSTVPRAEVSLAPSAWQSLGVSQSETVQSLPLTPFPWLSCAQSKTQQSRAPSKAKAEISAGGAPEPEITEPDITGPEIVALAAIGHPQRFFDTLQTLGIASTNLSFDDHHVFDRQDLSALHSKVLLMTTKDAVKCVHFATEENQWFALEVTVRLEPALLADVVALMTHSP